MASSCSFMRSPGTVSVRGVANLMPPAEYFLYPSLNLQNSSHTFGGHLTTHHDYGNRKRYQSLPVLRYPRGEIRCLSLRERWNQLSRKPAIQYRHAERRSRLPWWSPYQLLSAFTPELPKPPSNHFYVKLDFKRHTRADSGLTDVKPGRLITCFTKKRRLELTDDSNFWYCYDAENLELLVAQNVVRVVREVGKNDKSRFILVGTYFATWGVDETLRSMSHWKVWDCRWGECSLQALRRVYFSEGLLLRLNMSKGTPSAVILSHLKRIGLEMVGCLIRRTRSSVGRRNSLFEKSHKLLVESAVWRLGGWARLLSRSKIGVRTAKCTQWFSGDYFGQWFHSVMRIILKPYTYVRTHSFSRSKSNNISVVLLPLTFHITLREQNHTNSRCR